MLKNKRTCVVCRKKVQKNKLVRWVLKNQKLQIDETKEKNGRGFYTCSKACVMQLANSSINNRNLINNGKRNK